MSAKKTHKYIAAFADGELDVEQNIAVLEVMTMSPQTTRRIMHQQQLRQAVRRHVHERTPQTPAGLKERIEHLTATTTPEAATGGSTGSSYQGPGQGQGEATGVLARIGRRSPALAAAMLLGALLSGIIVAQITPGGLGTAPPTSTPATLLVDADTDRFAARHDHCADDIDALRGATRYPDQLEALPDAVAARLDLSTDEVGRLDLTGSGYEFWRAGDCALPGDKSVHLVYRAMPESGHTGTLSVWIVQNGEGKLDHLVEGRPYWLAGDEHGHPMVVWRHGRTAFYLMGNRSECVERATMTLIERA